MPDDVIVMVGHVVDQLLPAYRRFVSRDDLYQEVALYAVGSGKRHVDKLVAADDSAWAFRAMFGAGKQFCEREKAAASGYDFDDVAWYTPEKIADILPVALDAGWDGLTGESEDDDGGRKRKSAGREGGNLIAMVADIRKALSACPDARYTLLSTPDTADPARRDARREALARLADWLGGEFPSAPAYQPGRRAVSNDAAVAATRNGYSE